MLVLGRNLNIMEYYEERLKKNLSGIAQDINFSIIISDLKYIVGKVEEVLKIIAYDNRVLTSYEIKYITYRMLLQLGYNKLAKAYMEVL